MFVLEVLVDVEVVLLIDVVVVLVVDVVLSVKKRPMGLAN